MIKPFFLGCMVFALAGGQECPMIEAPQKLQRLIERHIGTENFFAGQNSAAPSMQIAVPKDASYYAFDLYRTVSMGTGIGFAPGRQERCVRIAERPYTVSVRFENGSEPQTGREKTTIVMIFRPHERTKVVK